MCLGIPGQLVGFSDESDLLAAVEVAGVRRTINSGLVKDDGVALGDWVLLHVGFAMSIIDEDEARRGWRACSCSARSSTPRWPRS